MKLSIIIPCYNEKATILRLLEAVAACPYPNKEIILVDDFSTDGTRELLEKQGNSCVDHMILHEKNSGKGAALRTGIKVATGDIVIIQDADLEYNPQEIPDIIRPIVDDLADVVYGSRFIGGERRRVLYFWHMVGNTFLTLLSNMLTNLNLSDMETCYKAFRREIIQSIDIRENRFGFEPEITAKISKKKCRIFEVGISYNGRTYNEGKKINWKDGLTAVWCILRYNFFP